MIESWGKFPKVTNVREVPIFWTHENFYDASGQASILAYGMGRSYGDSCLNEDNSVVLTRGLNRFISFNKQTGLIRCEAGVTFEEILRLVVPQGWFLPVTPGTKFVTVGGAVANDVHGKNHHHKGNFGHHVTQFELRRSSGETLLCSKSQNSEFFYATIGGIGLTGFITWVEFQLSPIYNAFISQEVIKFGCVDEFFELSKSSEKDFQHTVSWIDCLSSGRSLGRGLFIRGNYAPAQIEDEYKIPNGRKKNIPLNFPSWSLNPVSLKAFNFLYYHKQLKPASRSLVHYEPFFYPLDSINNWNRIYGAPGFLQYQCVVPYNDGGAAIKEILAQIARERMGSFLAVLKTFGNIPSLGLMSFPRQGVTLALDFPNKEGVLFKLLNRLDKIVVEVGGSVYLAKDARISAQSFEVFYPRFGEFEKFIDPKFSSSLWRRVRKK